MSARPKRWPPPWLFLILILPGGVYNGFIQTPLSFLLGKAGVAVDRIANIESLLQVPPVVYFLWAPLVDMKLRRRTWLVLASIVSAGCLAFAMPLIATRFLTVVTVLLLAGMTINVMVSSAQGGMMVATLSRSGQAQASAWTQAGNLGGGALGAGISMWLLARTPMAAAISATAAMMVLPSLAALTVEESLPVQTAGFRDHLWKVGKELITVFHSRRTVWGLLLLASPVSSGAALNLLPAVASHYGVGAQGVMWVNGMAGGLVLALGSLLATLVPGEWDRRLTYAGAGLLNGLATLTLMAGDRSSVYFVGTVLYLVTTGFGYARFTALVMDVLGPGEHGVSTRYSLFLAAGNLPIAYVLWLDGQGFRRFGTHGLFGVDAAGNFLVFAIVMSAWLLRRKNT
jgi:MFS transporter, PAT family, beta-lactamase induction signal transducer AmpG